MVKCLNLIITALGIVLLYDTLLALGLALQIDITDSGYCIVMYCRFNGPSLYLESGCVCFWEGIFVGGCAEEKSIQRI